MHKIDRRGKRGARGVQKSFTRTDPLLKPEIKSFVENFAFLWGWLKSVFKKVFFVFDPSTMTTTDGQFKLSIIRKLKNNKKIIA